MPPTELAVTNTSAITVSELASALKRTLEDRFGYVKVRGEVSGYRGPHVSGHVYFSLKDEAARLDAVIWKTTFLRMRVKPSEGLEVVASGKLTAFAGKSSYQIIVESIEPAGIGALMALLDTRRRQLAAEGLFNVARKRRLPYLPRRIGVITSPDGAVIRDILHRFADRFPVHVLVWPVRVQGETSADEVAAAIVGFNNLGSADGILRPDVLIVARGGGSLEDLWSFNEENVARAAANSAIPLVSAVGHETDWTLIDHAADLRAPTPTAAAELCVPVRWELISRITTLRARVSGAMTQHALRNRAVLRSAARGLPSGEGLLTSVIQRMDRAGDVLVSKSRYFLSHCGLRIASLARDLARYSPHVQSARAVERARSVFIRLRRFGFTPVATARLSVASADDELRHAVRSDFHERIERLRATELRWQFRQVEAKRRSLERRATYTRVCADLRRAFQDALSRHASAVGKVSQLFAAVSYTSVLARGYALVQRKSGGPLSSAFDARTARDLTIRFSDGEVSATVQNRSATRRRKRSFSTEQQDLF